MTEPLSARLEKKSEVAGIGCVVQAIGLLFPFVGALGGEVGVVVGVVVMLAFLVYGSHLSAKWVCGNCKNPVAGRDVRVCPTCRANLS